MRDPAPLHIDVELAADGGIHLPARVLRPAGFARGMSIRIYVEDDPAFALRYLGFDNAASIPGWEIAKRGFSGHSHLRLRVEVETRTEQELEADANEKLERLPPKSDEQISEASVRAVRGARNNRPS